MSLSPNTYFARTVTVVPLALVLSVATFNFLGSQTIHAEESKETCTTVAIDVGVPDQKADQAGTQVCSTGDDVKTNVIYIYLKAIINFLAIGVGLAVAVSIAIGGFGYITSEGNPQKLSAAKNRLFHAVMALILFILMYALLQFLIPGGLV